MSKRLFQVFSVVVVVAMLMAGVGVIPAFALPGVLEDNALNVVGAVNYTDLPFTALTGLELMADGVAALCGEINNGWVSVGYPNNIALTTPNNVSGQIVTVTLTLAPVTIAGALGDRAVIGLGTNVAAPLAVGVPCQTSAGRNATLPVTVSFTFVHRPNTAYSVMFGEVVAGDLTASDTLTITAVGINSFRDSRTVAQNNPAVFTAVGSAGYHYNAEIDMSAAGLDPIGDMAGCSVAPGLFTLLGEQAFLYDANARTGTRYIRIHYETALDVGGVFALGVFRASDLLEYGCSLGSTVGANQIVDLVVAVPANTPYFIAIARIGAAPLTDTTANIWVLNASQAGGGLIVTGTPGVVPLNGLLPGDAVQVNDGTNRALFTVLAAAAPLLSVAAPNAWFNVPAGVYAVGVARPAVGGVGGLAAAYPAVAGGFRSLSGIDDPFNAANVPVTLNVKDENGAGIAAGTLSVLPSNGSLFINMNLGVIPDTGVFNVSSGIWDAQLVRDAAGVGPDYFLVSNSIGWWFPFAATWTFNVQSIGAYVEFNTGVKASAYDACQYRLDPPGPLGPTTAAGALQWLAWTCDNSSATVDNTLYLTAGTNYDASQTIRLTEAGWMYYFVPTIPTWNFAANVTTAAYVPTFGGIPFETTASITSGFAFNRGNYTDVFGNILNRITAPDGQEEDCFGDPIAADGVADEIAPCDVYQRGVAGFTQLANDWLITALGPVSAIGRYEYTRSLQVALDVTSVSDINDGYITVPDADVSNPFFNYIMALYEAGITSGVTATSYGADLPITRGQLARYLSQSMVFGGLVKPAGPAAATFTDVPTTHVFYADVQWLNLLGITTGTSATVFGVNDYATREVMAVWAEKAARWMALNGAGIAPPPYYPALGTLGPDYTGGWAPTGVCWDASWWPSGVICNSVYYDALFDDVPSANANALWIEEAAADGITVGISGLPGSNWIYGPALSITRGQMAAFMGRSVLDANPYFAGPWVFPSPMK